MDHSRYVELIRSEAANQAKAAITDDDFKKAIAVLTAAETIAEIAVSIYPATADA